MFGQLAIPPPQKIFEKDAGILRAREIVSILADEFGVPAPKVVRGRGRGSDYYDYPTARFPGGRVTLRATWDADDPKDTYALLHEFAHHLTYHKYKKKEHHESTFCHALGQILKAWGQEFKDILEYKSVQRELLVSMGRECPVRFKPRPEPEPRKPAKFKVGTVVKVNAPRSKYHGATGVVKAVPAGKRKYYLLGLKRSLLSVAEQLLEPCYDLPEGAKGQVTAKSPEKK